MKYVAPDRSPIPPKQSARCFATFAESKSLPAIAALHRIGYAAYNVGCSIGLDTRVVVDPAEPDVLDPFCHRSRGRSCSWLIISPFHLPSELS